MIRAFLIQKSDVQSVVRPDCVVEVGRCTYSYLVVYDGPSFSITHVGNFSIKSEESLRQKFWQLYCHRIYTSKRYR